MKDEKWPHSKGNVGKYSIPLAILCHLFGIVKWPPTRWSKGHFESPGGKYSIPSLKLTWHLKMMVSNRNLLFQGCIFRCYVSFKEGTFQEKIIPFFAHKLHPVARAPPLHQPRCRTTIPSGPHHPWHQTHRFTVGKKKLPNHLLKSWKKNKKDMKGQNRTRNSKKKKLSTRQFC